MRVLSIASTTPTTTSAYHVTDTCVVDAPASRSSARTEMKSDTTTRNPASASADEVLRLAVPELMRHVGRTRRDANREEREQRRDEIGAGVSRLGDEAEAVRREPDGQLEDDERRRGRDGDER